MENIVLHLKFVRSMRGALLSHVVQHHMKVAHISLGYGAYLDLDEEIIARAPIANSKLNLMLSGNSG